MRSFLFPVVLVAAVLLGACAPAQKAGPAKLSAPALAEKAVSDLGSETRAFNAVASAWGRGYSLKQIIKGIQGKKLLPNGVIDGQTAGLEPVRLAAVTLASHDGARPEAKPSIDEVIEARKAGWTAWLLGVIEKGYSVEQITAFMLEHDRPVEISFNGIGPIITTARDADKTGAPPLGMDGKPLQRVVKPAFPPKGTYFNPIDVDGAERFTSDLAKDFDDLVSGKGELRPATDGKPAKGAKGKFEPRSFRLKLKFMPSEKTKTMTSSDVILRIDAAGQATGSYNVEITSTSGQYTTTVVEDGTFAGQAVYPKAKGQMIRMDLDGSRHKKSTMTGSYDGKPVINEQDTSVRKLFQGVLAVDYSKGSGFLFGESGMYQWRIE